MVRGGTRKATYRIRQQNKTVSYFSNPNDLEARISTAVTVAGMSKQVELNLADVGQVYDTVNDSSPEQGIRDAIKTANQRRVLKVDINSTWWSTRLFLTSMLAERLTETIRDLDSNYNVKVVFVDDGRRDDSWEIIKRISIEDRRFSGIRLSRNFGHQAALTCGYHLVQGDAVITIDADLQDPPEVMLEMIRKWENGSKVVLGVRRKRYGESLFKLWTAKFYYWLINKLSETRSTEQAGDFRLLDRAVVITLNKIDERHRYIRGLVGWIGFETDYIEYERSERFSGKSKYKLTKMIRLAMDGIVSFSFVPLRIAYAFSLFLMLPFLIYLIYNLFLRYFYQVEILRIIELWPTKFRE